MLKLYLIPYLYNLQLGLILRLIGKLYYRCLYIIDLGL